jgi:hypothetical protein
MTVESALLAAFTAQLGPLQLICHEVTPWHSATFAGERHVFEIAPERPFGLDTFEGVIVDQEIRIPRGFVADIAIGKDYASTAHQFAIEVLTIDA